MSSIYSTMILDSYGRISKRFGQAGLMEPADKGIVDARRNLALRELEETMTNSLSQIAIYVVFKFV